MPRKEGNWQRWRPAPAGGPAVETVHAYLEDADSGWSIGTDGAIAEFLRAAEEPATVEVTENGGQVETACGALHAVLGAGVEAVAYERISSHPGRWSHGIVFCVLRAMATGNCRQVLTEAGPDGRAARPTDRDAILFDMGVGAPHVDFCVRTADPSLIAELRRAEGTDVLIPDHPAMAAIKEANPHRVCLSALGRIEVYQPIASSGTRTPEGPHTHLLPELLETGRTHAPGTPVPTGTYPCLGLHPPHPLSDALGHERPFDAAVHASFQALLERFAPPGFVEEKRRIIAAVLDGEDPAAYAPAATPEGRAAARVALRQLIHTHGEVAELDAWCRFHDREEED